MAACSFGAAAGTTGSSTSSTAAELALLTQHPKLQAAGLSPDQYAALEGQMLLHARLLGAAGRADACTDAWGQMMRAARMAGQAAAGLAAAQVGRGRGRREQSHMRMDTACISMNRN